MLCANRMLILFQLINEKTKLKEVNPNLQKVTEQVEEAGLSTAQPPLFPSQPCLQLLRKGKLHTLTGKDPNSR